jgi:pyruvate carboxylase
MASKLLADDLSLTSSRQVFEEFRTFIEKYGDLSVVPTRFFLAKPALGEEMHISIEQGKMLIIKLLAVGPIDEGKGTRECCTSLSCLSPLGVSGDERFD